LKPNRRCFDKTKCPGFAAFRRLATEVTRAGLSSGGHFSAKRSEPSRRLRMPCLPTTAARSALMRRVKSTGNRSTEYPFMAALRRVRVKGWRRHLRIRLPATHGSRGSVRPDFVFREARLAIFLDGCFWHRCPRHFREPSRNRVWWCTKIDGNVRRDRRNRTALRAIGWSVFRIWEHELRANPDKCAQAVLVRLKSLKHERSDSRPCRGH
jgi:DNA mismatch endonuclease (patch repair protein)